jgi:hypothetical protein
MPSARFRFKGRFISEATAIKFRNLRNVSKKLQTIFPDGKSHKGYYASPERQARVLAREARKDATATARAQRKRQTEQAAPRRDKAQARAEKEFKQDIEFQRAAKGRLFFSKFFMIDLEQMAYHNNYTKLAFLLTGLMVVFQRRISDIKPRKTLRVIRQHETTGPYANREIKIAYRQKIKPGVNEIVKNKISEMIKHGHKRETMFYAMARFKDKTGNKFFATIVPRTEL